MSGNPYAAPEAVVTDAPRSASLPLLPAGKWRRFFNLLVDWIACWVLSTIMMVAYLTFLLVTDGEYLALQALEDTNLLRDYAIGIVTMLLYYILLEGVFGITLGKLLTGTRVVSEDGGRPSWGQVVGRTFARLIPFEPLSLLFSIDGQARGWHDSLPRTWVVRRR